MNGSAARRNPSLPASGLRGSADGHLPWSAAARFKAVRGMHAAVIVTAIVLVVVTAALALAPQLHLGYPQEAADLALDTAASVIGLLACFLVFGRLRRRTRLNELLLAGALAVLALSNLFLCTVPVVAGWAPDDLTVWLAPVAISFGALLFVLAAFLPDRRLRPSGPLLVVGAGAVTHSAAGDHDLRPRVRSTRCRRRRWLPWRPARPSAPISHPAQFGLQLAGAVLYGAAAVGFLRCFAAQP